MPYEGEKANPSGYVSLLNSEYIRERLTTFKPYSAMRKQDVYDNIPQVARTSKELDHSLTAQQTTHIISIDGSRLAVERENPSMEFGFIKVGVVVENLKGLRRLRTITGPLNPEYLEKCYTIYDINSILPGHGVVDAEKKITEWDKFRLEVFETARSLEVDPRGVFRTGPQKLTLLEVLKQLVPDGRFPVKCVQCQKITAVGVVPERCAHCGRFMLYLTDMLNLHENFTELGSNVSQFNEAMSTFERLVMAGLLMKASEREETFRATAFFTDGPLALFRSRALAPLLLRQAQELPHPILAGFEKTGNVVDFAMDATTQHFLKPGHVGMITSEVAQVIAERKISYGSRDFYGCRFMYRTEDGNNTYVFAVPPAQNSPYGTMEQVASGTVADHWSDYPTLSAICELIEETRSMEYGSSVAALTGIARANRAASIPTNLGQDMLADMVRKIFPSEVEEAPAPEAE